MNLTTVTASVANHPFTLGETAPLSAISIANQATDSLQIFADRLQEQIPTVGNTSAGDVSLCLMFSILKARAAIRKDVLAMEDAA